MIIKSDKQIQRMQVLAATVLEMGDPRVAGKGVADIIRFLVSRISDEKRPQAVSKLRTKIWALDEYDIASKKNPSTASLGQSITFIKTILIGHHPLYIRQVLEHIVRNLY